MKEVKPSLSIRTRLPALVASIAILWVGSVNIHFNPANTPQRGLDVILARPQDKQAVMRPATTPQNPAVLSARDADLYKNIFKAQSIADWDSADMAIDDLKDRSLMGHVLADRYERRAPTPTEVKEWLANYADLPEADAVFDHFQGDTVADTQSPATGDVWSGSQGYGISSHFKGETGGKMSASVRRLTDKIARALHRGEPEAALSVLQAETEKTGLPSDDRTKLQAQIAEGFLHDGQADKARQLADDAAQVHASGYALWLSGLAAWKQNDVHGAAEAFSKLAALDLPEGDHAAASFWAYRALTKAGDADGARKALDQAADHPRSFYGFMAAHLLGKSIAWTWQVPALTKHNLAALTDHPAGQRALALIQIGQLHWAEEELRRLNPRGDQDLQDAMLSLADKEHMPALALQLGSLATTEDGKLYDAALYPLPSWKPEAGFSVDPALLYAIMRRESQFNPEAVSPRGACGLMQLMPATAAVVSNEENIGCTAAMREPARNIALGQDYVHHLSSLPMIGDNLLFLLTAYNGGPGNLERWMDSSMRGDPLLFIESLPSRETHDYVQQVLMHYWSYRARLAEPETSLSQIATGEWPRYASISNAVKTAQAHRVVASAR